MPGCISNSFCFHGFESDVAAESTFKFSAGRDTETTAGEGVSRLDVLTAGQCVDIPADCTEHTKHGEQQAGRGASSDVSCRPETSRSLRSLRPAHVCWNSPPIKTGISQVRCGNQPSVGKHSVGACVLPSPALGPHAASLPRPSRHSHPYCTSSAFSPSFLSFLHSFFFYSYLSPLVQNLFLHSPVSSLELCTATHFISSPLSSLFPTFSFIATTQISIAFSPNSSGLSEVHGSCVLAGSCSPPFPSQPPSLPPPSLFLMPLCSLHTDGLSGGELGTLA